MGNQDNDSNGGSSHLTIDEAYNKAVACYNAEIFVDADSICVAILKQVPDHVGAINLLGLIAQRLHRHVQALEFFQHVIKLEKNNGMLYYNQGISLYALGRYDDAKKSLKNALEKEPGNSQIQTVFDKIMANANGNSQEETDLAKAKRFFSQGAALHKAGKFKEALVQYKNCLCLKPNDISSHCNMGSVFVNLGELDQAVASFQRVIEIKPDYIEALNSLAHIYLLQEKIDKAVEVLKKSIAIKNDDELAHFSLASALQQMGKLDAAQASYRQAIKINPDNSDFHYKLGALLHSQEHFLEALKHYQKAIEINPSFADAYNNVGVILQRVGKFDEAVINYKKAIQIAPDFAQYYYNLGYALQKQGKIDEAVNNHKKSIELDPNLCEAHYNLAFALREQLKYKEAIDSYKKVIALNPKYVDAFNNIIFFTDLYYPIDSDQFQKEREAWNKLYAEPLRSSWPTLNNRADPNKILRIGYVGADFVNHSASHIFGSMILDHDPEKFEIYCYAGNKVEDDLTKKFKQKAAGWLSTTKMDDVQLSAAIQKDGIDILVDLAGHTIGNRMLTFARKPAPIQLQAWGYPHGTAMAAMDYILADEIFIPHSQRSNYKEQIVDISCVIHLSADIEYPLIEMPPVCHNGYITFGAFNRIEKYNYELYKTWAAILKRIPTAKLLIKTGKKFTAKPNSKIEAIFAELGVAKNRLEFIGKSPKFEHLKALNRVDIMLDPFPHNGGMTTLDSLRMGVPVLTCEGNTRCPTSASILNVLGLDDWRALDDLDYIKKACEFAGQISTLKQLRQDLRSRFDKSALGNSQLYVAEVENRYRQLWQKWCNSKK
ncbi:MAG: tetratricopeptide repeat protein [Magnetococcales bacterium]|nr:tetratricopeptide repeat protein [Magnetococcales bacterium]